MALTGFVTIGQSPREDILNSMLPANLQQGTIQRGALDDLSIHEIDELSPIDGETPFVTRLRDGREAHVAKTRLMPYLQSAVDRVVSDGASAVVILCTGSFPDLKARCPLVFPDRVLTATVNALLPNGTLGVVMPHEGQMDLMQEKWQAAGRQFAGVAASPYSASRDLEHVGEQLARAGADMIVLDCMGFTEAMKQTILQVAYVPVILSNRLVGRVIEEIAVTSAAAASGTEH